jgi:hypothetical protein
MPGKRVSFDDETWQALSLLGKDTVKDFQELADEAFRDLLRKHNRPVGLKAALRQSAGRGASVTSLADARSRRGGGKAGGGGAATDGKTRTGKAKRKSARRG